ncbi:hypothetical protein NPIL_263441, partial [Nephila pilipes]
MLTDHLPDNSVQE